MSGINKFEQVEQLSIDKLISEQEHLFDSVSSAFDEVQKKMKSVLQDALKVNSEMNEQADKLLDEFVKEPPAENAGVTSESPNNSQVKDVAHDVENNGLNAQYVPLNVDDLMAKNTEFLDQALKNIQSLSGSSGWSK